MHVADDGLMTKQEAARFLKIVPRTLELLEKRGEAPPRVNLGIRRAMYRRSDLLTWINQRVVHPNAA
jgi:predicted DNA-binding transcriptional regulator AlpA